ncbi:MAG: N-acetyltransferase [Muribaculaceae bacterium]|nr:N-acetyltransferase [Muribaculaceae bacterium]
MVNIREIKPTRGNLLKFIKFGIDLYEGNGCYVPPLVIDELSTLDPAKNPASEFCDQVLFMAERDGKQVGRIAGIINRMVNERTGKCEVRFGFVDFIDDAEVADALFEAVRNWGKTQGMTSIVGPMGYTDMDHEGMLVDGFDEMGTMATIYNYPYYSQHMERMGFVKEIDWVEFRIAIPDSIPDKMLRIAKLVQTKYGLRTLMFTDRKKLKEEYGQALFELINEAYDQLYGYSPLTQRQIDHYIKMYLDILRLENVSLVVDVDSKLVGVGISMPSLSEALRKSRGRLMPLGWWHLLRAIKGYNPVVDLLLVAVKPEYQSKGVNALLFTDLIPVYQSNGYKWAESNPELEENASVQLQWQYFEKRQHRRRRCFRKDI